MPITRERVKKETKFVYTNKFMAEELEFRPSEDEVVATFDELEAADAASTLSMRATSTPLAARSDRGFAILRLGEEETTAKAMDSLEAEDKVANVLPVLFDQADNRRYFLPDELTVQFQREITPEQAREIIEAQGCRVVVQQRTPGYFTLSVPKDKGLFETLRAFSELEEVAFAEPSEVGLDDTLVEATAEPPVKVAKPPEAPEPTVRLAEGELPITEFGELTGFEEGIEVPALPEFLFEEEEDVLALPSDTHFGKLWGLHNTGQMVNGTAGLADADIDAPQAWTITKGSDRVVVAVVDTGADLDHPDLAPNLFPRGAEDWDFADPTDNVPWDSGYHGSHVAGTATAPENGQGVVGVAPHCRTMPLRVKLISGMNANRADAINYVAEQAATHPELRFVINCSWKMSGNFAGVHNAIQNAVAHNVVVIFAAGNSYGAVTYPAVYPEVIAVAATDQQDVKPNFSAFGPEVDVSAPGVNVYSSMPDDTYGYLDGTSMASPHVAGLAALIWSRNPSLTNAQVRSIIETTCDDVYAKNPTLVGKLGAGRINAYRALKATPAPPIPWKLLRELKYPQPNAGSSTGLSFVPKIQVPWFGIRPALAFLTQKAYSEQVFFMNPWSGAVLRTVDPVANDTIGSLAWDGAALRVANVTVGAGSINRINPFTGAQIGSIPAPAGRGEGLAAAGPWLFYSTINRIHILWAPTGAVVRSYPPPGGPCRALTFGGGWLFSGNSLTGEVTVFHPWTLHVRGIITVPGGGAQRIEGLAYDATRRTLYVANQSQNKIYALAVFL
ncbi:MAG: S8 family serine peptidase [bacterium]|nr:S8 family serine peptidase [bacterium]